MIYSFEELDKMSLDLLEKYNNNELYYINMDNKNIFMLLQFLYGRCLISEELKVKFSPLYDHLFQTQIYRNYSDEDIAFLVDNLLIDKDTHEVTKFLDVVCSWNNLGKKVLDYMYDKGYYDEMAKITNPLIFMYPNEKESYAKKISGRVIIYDFSDEKYKIKQAVFAIASGFDNFKVANYIKFLLYEKKIDRLYLLYFFRDYLLDEDEKKAFDENLKVIVGIEGIEKIKKDVSSVKTIRSNKIGRMLDLGIYYEHFNNGFMSIIDEEVLTYRKGESEYAFSHFKNFFLSNNKDKENQDNSNFVEKILNGNYLFIHESILFTPFYGYYTYKGKKYYCDGKNTIELLFKHKKTADIDNFIKDIKSEKNLIVLFDLYKKYNLVIPYQQLRRKILFDVQHCLTDEGVNELAYDYEQSKIYFGSNILHSLELIDASQLDNVRRTLQVCSISKKKKNVIDLYNSWFSRSPKIKPIRKFIKKNVDQYITVAQVRRRYVESYDDSFGTEVVLEEKYETLLNELKDLFMNDGVSDKKLVQYLINSYRYVLSENSNEETNHMFACEIRSLIKIKKEKNVSLCLVQYVNGSSHFSPSTNTIYVNSIEIGSKVNTIMHEVVHLLHYNNANDKIPNEFYEMSYYLLLDKDFMKRVKEFAKYCDSRCNISKQSVRKLLAGRETSLVSYSPDKDTLVELMKKSSLSENEIKTLMGGNSLSNILSGEILAKKKKDIMIKELEAVIQNLELDVIFSVSDIIDAILGGMIKDDGISTGIFKMKKTYDGHGKDYYAKKNNRFIEVIAQYGTILKSKNQNSGKKPTPLELLTNIVGADFVEMLDVFYKEYIAHYYDRRDDVNERK